MQGSLPNRGINAWHPLLLGALLSGCVAGPDYQRPQPPGTPAALTAYSEDGVWRPAAPANADDHTPWWQRYGDAELDALVMQAMGTNQTLSQAQAQVRQAEAIARGQGSRLWPTLDGAAQAERARTRSSDDSRVSGSRDISLQASWEPDLWGRMRRSLEAANADARASQADLAGARLGIQAAVVQTYIQLRLGDSLHELYLRSVDGYQRSLAIAEARSRVGVATQADVALARTTLATSQAQAIDVDLVRSQAAHALAVLLGQPPADFRLESAPLALQLPATPAAVPSSLLERRPDIAAAEQRVQAANAQIGVARAAWFPELRLAASGGESVVGSWASAPGAVWAVGATLAANLFDGGARRALSDEARGAFDAAAATYRQTVLSGFQDVEDNLAALRELSREREYGEQALQAARESETILLRQYESGTTNYLSVIDAQALALGSERTALQLRARELAAGVALIKALGGAATE
ncbi:MAG: efflux transporter outer membrane subunit [Pseudomonadota bacterium]